MDKRKEINIEDCIAENITFGATLQSKNIKNFISIIKAMNFIDNTEMHLSENGMKYIVEESKSFQTSAYFTRNFFSTFHMRLPHGIEIIKFGLNLSSFTDLLNAFLDNDLSNMNIVYYHHKSLLSFTITQTDEGEPGEVNDDEPAGEILTEYFITTKQSTEPIDFGVNSAKFHSWLILNAQDFYDIINDFDRTIEELEVKISDRTMTLRSVGVLQFVAVAKLSGTSEVFNKFQCNETTKLMYKFKFFKVMLKALALSSKISLKTHVDGMVYAQLMVRNDEEESSAFVEYFIIPTLPESDDEDDED